MNFKMLAENRYSCRKFLKQDIEKDKVNALLDVIHVAPSAKNCQPIRIWTIQSEERLMDIKKITKYHYDAPLTIAIGFVADEAWTRDCDNKNMGIVDASIAGLSVWFEATELGLGCVWVSDFDVEKQKEYFPEMAECEIVAFMQLGYPDLKSKPAKWHYDKKERSKIFCEL